MSGADLGLTLPLTGVQLIEASAGTGKTFTVATLYTRLVIEAGLPVSRLLAVTFTEAATRELRDTLRTRLVLARRLLDGADDLFSLAAADGDDAETLLSKELLRAALAREDAGLLRRRLRLAVEQMDLAPIHTIHAFCQRALFEHALLAGRSLAPRELLQNEAGLRREAATAFWRQQSRTTETSVALAGVWKSPQLLAASLVDLLAPDALRPDPPPDASIATLAALREARRALADAYREHHEAAFTAFMDEWLAGGLNRNIYKENQADAVSKALWRWHEDPLGRDPGHEKLGNYAQAKLKKGTNKKGTTPVSPLFKAIEDWQHARIAHDEALAGRRLAMVHAARDFAGERLARLKRERGLVGFDDLIRDMDAALLDPDGGDAFAEALQRQYAVALVDEFQDTDPRQWRIFERLFAKPAAADGEWPRALILIGDPKQAIYGFRGGDVATYLAAKARAPMPAPLRVNFRSRPRAIAAVQALFQLGGPGAFAHTDFDFIEVQAARGQGDAAFEVDGAPGPGLLLQALASDAGNIDQAREQATAHCVAAIHALLQAGQQGRARMQPRRGDRQPRGVQPGDISVLVPTNKDALRIQRALSAAGIPSVAAGRCSIYNTDEARDVCWLLEALAAPADDGRLRALLASPLFALDAAALAALDTDLAAHRGRQDALQRWLQRARRHGPMAALAEICAQEAPRLLALPDGERRLSNYLQLAEELQSADLGTLGIPGLLAELEHRIADADDNSDAELLRLESDAARVRIMTLHVSKGLTLDFVFLPYAATCGGNRPPPTPPMARGREGLLRVAHLYPEKNGDTVRAAEREESAEDVRLLYVALTRARLMTWLAWGACKHAEGTALGWLLHRGLGAEPGALTLPDAADIEARLEALRAAVPEAIAIAPASEPPAPESLPRLAFADAAGLPPARAARRAIDRDWWVYSFSQLAREDSGAFEAGGADDEPEPTPLERSRFSGTRFGNALHQTLEHVDFAIWRDWRDVLPPPGQFEPLQLALAEHGFSSEADQQEGLPILSAMVRETLNAPMPEGTRLALLPAAARSAEMEFHLSLPPLMVARMLELLHAHGLVPERRNFGRLHRLEGLLTGKIDLVYEAEGRYYVLDYKSNQLADYGSEALARAVREGEYDLQYVLYTLALHRWLRFRLGADYDIGTHLGGVRYLFCRGLDRHDAAAPGVHALRLPDALVLALDDLFSLEAA